MLSGTSLGSQASTIYQRSLRGHPISEAEKAIIRDFGGEAEKAIIGKTFGDGGGSSSAGSGTGWPKLKALLFFSAGVFIGSGALTARWINQSSVPPDEEDEALKKVSRRERKRRLAAQLEAEQAAEEAMRCTGTLQRWVWASPWIWWPHWRWFEAEVRQGLLLLHPKPFMPPESPSAAVAAGAPLASGHRAVALPLVGATIEQVGDSVKLRTAAGDSECLRGRADAEGLLVSSNAYWLEALSNATAVARPQHRRRTVSVDILQTWEEPLEKDRLVPLPRSSAEYKRVEKLALEQQYKGRGAIVKGSIKVKSISRVQAPHVWEQVTAPPLPPPPHPLRHPPNASPPTRAHSTV
jgi:hypothetical protein